MKWVFKTESPRSESVRCQEAVGGGEKERGREAFHDTRPKSHRIGSLKTWLLPASPMLSAPPHSLSQHSRLLSVVHTLKTPLRVRNSTGPSMWTPAQQLCPHTQLASQHLSEKDCPQQLPEFHFTRNCSLRQALGTSDFFGR